MNITFYDIFRYLRSFLDSHFSSDLILFVHAFVLQRLQNYTSRFPESMSYNLDIEDTVIDIFVTRLFIKSYVADKCGKFCPESLLLCIQFLDAYILSRFSENLLESPSLDASNY